MSKLSEYYAALDSAAPGWKKDRHQASLADTSACANTARGQAGSIQRMVTYINCRKGKRLPVATS